MHRTADTLRLCWYSAVFLLWHVSGMLRGQRSPYGHAAVRLAQRGLRTSTSSPVTLNCADVKAVARAGQLQRFYGVSLLVCLTSDPCLVRQ